MRRDKQEITDKNILDEVMSKAIVCRLGLAVENKPYVVPVCFGYDGDNLYFHSPLEGQKLDMLRENPKVCFEMEHAVKLITHEKNACAWSVSYRSIIGRGKASELTDNEDKTKAFDIIMKQYSDKDWDYPEATLDRTSVWRIEITELTGKQTKDYLE